MKQIQFDSGIREYGINGDDSRVIRIMISDMNLGKRIADLESRVSELADKYRAVQDPDAEQLAALDRDVRSIINEAFNSDICTPAFGATNCCSPVAGGKMLFEGFLAALTEQVKADIAELKPSAPRPEVAAYLEDRNPAEPARQIDISALSDEQRRALVSELLGQE